MKIHYNIVGFSKNFFDHGFMAHQIQQLVVENNNKAYTTWSLHSFMTMVDFKLNFASTSQK